MCRKDNDQVEITGAYMDKTFLIGQHQWISPQHMNQCECFDNFKTSIHHLAIGNPDDMTNRMKNLEMDKTKLESQIEELRNGLH